MDRKQHWENRYQGTSTDKLTWFQTKPELSLRWIKANCKPEQALIDIGAGASTLVDYLLADGYCNISLLDLAESSLQASRDRLEAEANRVHWLVADITAWQPPALYHLWHDRAVFHFLTKASDRAAYKAALLKGLEVGGSLIMATFAPNGPEKCSGLPIVQYSPESLQQELGDGFELQQHLFENHPTPAGNCQLFNWCLFKRII